MKYNLQFKPFGSIKFSCFVSSNFARIFIFSILCGGGGGGGRRCFFAADCGGGGGGEKSSSIKAPVSSFNYRQKCIKFS
ncbi:hypothetical protein DERP_003470 [Dermatophagoides pteronyssinus]|uniref:Uncharacterized protein n=1 Tax=Dermatophagoides pteronyssinus TaxID=6956 RepID=A0ABQ8JKR5_DERPT|nr:hypothetical protein DERP_003470 [Dermatophagoides pteronyssinus]